LSDDDDDDAVVVVVLDDDDDDDDDDGDDDGDDVDDHDDDDDVMMMLMTITRHTSHVTRHTSHVIASFATAVRNIIPRFAFAAICTIRNVAKSAVGAHQTQRAVVISPLPQFSLCSNSQKEVDFTACRAAR
jgi:hypothetical protein